MDSKKIKLLLASASPRRRELLENIGLEFDIVPSDVDETLWNDAVPQDFVMTLAKRKAEFAAESHKDVWILAADTVVVYDEKILGKPADCADAVRMIELLQGRTHYVVTGVALVKPDGGMLIDCERTYVKFRSMTHEECEAYVDQGESMDKAGAYAIQGRGSMLVESIEGCYSNVVGLPVNRVAVMFEEAGYSLFENWRKN